MKYTLYTTEFDPITYVDLADEVEKAKLHDEISIGLYRIIKSIAHGHMSLNYIKAQKKIMSDRSIGLVVNKNDELLIRQVVD
jgi:hypothetical protein